MILLLRADTIGIFADNGRGCCKECCGRVLGVETAEKMEWLKELSIRKLMDDRIKVVTEINKDVRHDGSSLTMEQGRS